MKINVKNCVINIYAKTTKTTQVGIQFHITCLLMYSTSLMHSHALSHNKGLNGRESLRANVNEIMYLQTLIYNSSQSTQNQLPATCNIGSRIDYNMS